MALAACSWIGAVRSLLAFVIESLVGRLVLPVEYPPVWRCLKVEGSRSHLRGLRARREIESIVKLVIGVGDFGWHGVVAVE